MKGERKLLWKVVLGCAAGLISVTIIYVLNRAGLYLAWESIIAAGLIGAVAGVAEKWGWKVALGVMLGCIGWICGEVVSRQLFHSAATWISVGGCVGLTAGIMEKSPASLIGGVVLGVIGGLLGQMAGFSTIAVDSLVAFDMQAVTILCAAIFISLMLGLKRPKIAGATLVGVGESTKQESLEGE
jgi:hypothetical protein